MISVEEALRLIKNATQPLKPTHVPLADCNGLCLAEDATADQDSPPYDKAMMDGYAVRWEDENAERKIIGQITAGQSVLPPVEPGTAVAIMTGAQIPPGANAVVMYEKTEKPNDETVRLISKPPTAGQHIMTQATSLKNGQTVLTQGSTINAASIGILAECGWANPRAIPRPTVGVLATGNELVPVNEKPPLGFIRNSNSPMLTAAVNATGAAATDYGIAVDDEASLKAAIEKALEHDVVILSGGVSVGVLDLVPPTLESLGVKKIFHKVAMKPGKPTWFGIKENADGRKQYVFGLPGNPVSGLVCYEILVRPCLRALAGFGFEERPRVTAQLLEPLTYKSNRPTFRPGRLSIQGDIKTVTATAWAGSADLASMANVNALLMLPEGEVSWQARHEVTVVEL